jgi:hypothetical protein
MAQSIWSLVFCRLQLHKPFLAPGLLTARSKRTSNLMERSLDPRLAVVSAKTAASWKLARGGSPCSPPPSCQLPDRRSTSAAMERAEAAFLHPLPWKRLICQLLEGFTGSHVQEGSGAGEQTPSSKTRWAEWILLWCSNPSSCRLSQDLKCEMGAHIGLP